MQTRPLGNSDLEITPIGVGAWAMGGGGWAFAWGAQDDSDSIAAIEAAVDKGVNWVDTAAVYGLGHSEEIVGKALKSCSSKPYIFTKCERVWDADRKIGKSLKHDSILRECDTSLQRLGVDVIDLYQIHWPEPDEDVEEGWTAMAELKAAGKVRHIGLSNFNVSQMERALKIAPITSLQPPYSMLVRGVESDILPFCQKHNIGVISYSPMRNGLLSGGMTKERVANFPEDDFRRRLPDFQEPLLSKNLELVEKLREIGKPSEVAIAWVLANPAVTGAIVGMRAANQVDGVIGAAELCLNPDQLTEIQKLLAPA